jgi:signal transduction histidine kinase
MEQEEVISIFLQLAIIGLTLIVAFIAVIIYIRYQRNHDIRHKQTMQKDFTDQLLQARIEVQEQTFQHIGKELHDNIGQLLSTSRMLLGLTERELELPPDTLLTANATLGQAISELRSLSKSLDKEWLEQFNFSENLQGELARINAGNTVHAVYHQHHSILLKPDEQIILFRIVQEAIQNAIKHASPSHIVITVTQQQQYYCISIANDGNSFTGSGKGMGLSNMKHRTDLLGGVISWETNAVQGTLVTIQLPFKEDNI